MRDFLIVIDKHAKALNEQNLRRLLYADRAIIKDDKGNILYKQKPGLRPDVTALMLKFL